MDTYSINQVYVNSKNTTNIEDFMCLFKQQQQPITVIITNNSNNKNKMTHCVLTFSLIIKSNFLDLKHVKCKPHVSM